MYTKPNLRILKFLKSFILTQNKNGFQSKFLLSMCIRSYRAPITSQSIHISDCKYCLLLFVIAINDKYCKWTCVVQFEKSIFKRVSTLYKKLRNTRLY